MVMITNSIYSIKNAHPFLSAKVWGNSLKFRSGKKTPNNRHPARKSDLQRENTKNFKYITIKTLRLVTMILSRPINIESHPSKNRK